MMANEDVDVQLEAALAAIMEGRDPFSLAPPQLAQLAPLAAQPPTFSPQSVRIISCHSFKVLVIALKVLVYKSFIFKVIVYKSFIFKVLVYKSFMSRCYAHRQSQAHRRSAKEVASQEARRGREGDGVRHQCSHKCLLCRQAQRQQHRHPRRRRRVHPWRLHLLLIPHHFMWHLIHSKLLLRHLTKLLVPRSQVTCQLPLVRTSTAHFSNNLSQTALASILSQSLLLILSMPLWPLSKHSDLPKYTSGCAFMFTYY